VARREGVARLSEDFREKGEGRDENATWRNLVGEREAQVARRALFQPFSALGRVSVF
jgi:hypothetical protein